VIYRNDDLAAKARLLALKKEVTLLRRHPLADAARLMRERIAREERRNHRIAAAIARQRQRFGWLRPRSLTEVVVACALVSTTLTLALGLVFVFVGLALLV
jgi:hypothetical protein